METLRINRRHLSRLFWATVLEHTADSPYRPRLLAELDDLDTHRDQAAYNTGSVSLATGWALYSLARYFQPALIAEVGTFIGRSTLALHRGAPDALIHTCDISNDIDLNLGPRVVQYRRQSSVEMFSALKADEKTVDLLHVDGRLNEQDMGVFPRTRLIALDDFEGNEKGVINLINLHGIEPGYQVIYPPERELLREHGLTGYCNTAVALPNDMIRLVRQ
jgi:hypothetical protein